MAHIPLIMTTTQAHIMALIATSLEQTDLILYTDAHTKILQSMRTEQVATCINIHEMYCERIVGEIDGAVGNMAALWSAAAQPEIMEQDKFDQEVRQPILKNLQTNKLYHCPRTISPHSIYSLRPKDIYVEPVFAKIWIATYRLALLKTPLFLKIYSMVVSRKFKRVFLVGMRSNWFNASERKPRPDIKTNMRMLRAAKGSFRSIIIIAEMLAGEM